MDPVTGAGPKGVGFDEYMMKEYETIAQAHFNTLEQISSFFRYYLTILAVPIALIGVFTALTSQQALASMVSRLRMPVALVSFVIGIVGLFVLLFIVSLRMDAILYARSVNAIRKYFFDEAQIDLAVKLQLRVLPQTPSLPRYSEGEYFLPVILSFASFNSLYFTLGLAILYLETSTGDITLGPIPWAGWAVVFVFAAMHLFLYRAYAGYREHYYLKTYAMGVDIDGVLNEHRKHFSTLLAQNVGKIIDPDSITTIPLHEDPAQGVTQDDEFRVFNDPRYWTQMPVWKGAPEAIGKLRATFHLGIHIFTYRAWPTFGKAEPEYQVWIDAALAMLKQHPVLPPRPLRWLGEPMRGAYNRWLRMRVRVKLRGIHVRPIEAITRSWLVSYGIKYDKLTVERASEHVSDPRAQVRNRYYLSRREKLRFFVEDEAEKANKLAFICDVVFILTHPYNTKKRLASNIVRAESWDGIRLDVRKFS